MKRNNFPESGLFRKRSLWVKTFIDIVVCLLLAVPVLLLISFMYLVLRCLHGGEVFYCSERIGRNGKIFKMWKFRSMHPDSDLHLQHLLDNHEEFSAEWKEGAKVKDDPRITGIGRLLRVMSLDELPQFFNVLKGDMCLIGPRPIPPDEAANYAEVLDLYKQFKPGITGLWQISGRCAAPYITRIESCREYLLNWSVFMELKIIFMTIPAVLSRKGAY